MARLAIHPGEVLADELKELGISANQLARQVGVPQNRITQIIAGKRSITGDTALRLGHWFKTSAEFWLNLQTAYDLRIAEQAAGEEIKSLPVMTLAPSAPPNALRVWTDGTRIFIEIPGKTAPYITAFPFSERGLSEALNLFREHKQSAPSPAQQAGARKLSSRRSIHIPEPRGRGALTVPESTTG